MLRVTTLSYRTPDDVRKREEAAARCTKVIKRRVLKKQARKARAQHLVRCCLALGKKKASRKPFTELYADGHFTEGREEWQKELQRHCEQVYTDQEEAKDAQKKESNILRRKGDSSSQRTGVMQKSQLTWCCKPGPRSPVSCRSGTRLV